ncbi:MAG: tRNA guanosine(34) transglycosylase Tgt, partial [Clostridia bacterium]|nr:tRNA guanosine(34) transglycosylase Tgt [Clostridia bacterium]
GEIAGAMLLSLHNIAYLHKLMKGLRESILGGYVKDFAKDFYEKQGENGR